MCLALIPAYAGSTCGAIRLPSKVSAHPRLRGEHVHRMAHGPTGGGSSPLTRGAPRTSRSKNALYRLIPAYAGSTRYSLFISSSDGAHPRLRGEHLTAVALVPIPAGSSPLTRGAHMAQGGITRAYRLIPAYAGSTSAPPMCAASIPAHPRLRGEHRRAVVPRHAVGGSSPLTRGALSPPLPWSPSLRLIPAYAGSTPVVKTLVGGA